MALAYKDGNLGHFVHECDLTKPRVCRRNTSLIKSPTGTEAVDIP